MYRVEGKDGNRYEAPNLATLQQWVMEGRIISTTVVEDLLSGTEGPASGVEGLRLLAQTDAGVPVPPKTEYPRLNGIQITDFMVYAPLVRAVIATMVIPPIGVLAVIFAAKIPEILASGDAEKAMHTARVANMISNLALIIGILLFMFIMKWWAGMVGPVS
jgi:hypothetical protein